MKPRKRRWIRLRFRQKIRNALLAYYLTPILFILLASGVFFYFSAKRSLDEELGQRLSAVALGVANQIRDFHLTALELHDSESVTYKTLRERLNRFRRESNVARIYIFSLNNESLLDTDANVPLGAKYSKNQLVLTELDRVRLGKPQSSILFKGNDGQYYKSGFAPIEGGGRVLGIVGVDASATFFSNLHLLGRRLALFALACVMVVVMVSMILSRKIVEPIQHLVSAAQRIGEGQLDQAIEIRSSNEIGFLSFVMDEMRKNIVTRDRELQMMLRGIAHEVRNPLGGIELFAGMLQEEVKGSAGEAVKRIQQEVRTLKNLVEEFLDFARGPILQPSTVPLKPFLEDLRIAYQTEMKSRSIDYQVSVQDVQEIDVDPDQMRRVFLNLIRNSIQAMPKGGKIDIYAQAPNGQIEIGVVDTGVGIREDNLDKLFDPFFTTKEGGTGLGLSFVRKIVNAHGGEVRVKSHLGEGTEVTVVLPR